MSKDMKIALLAGAGMLVALSFVVSSVADYLDLPVIGIDQEGQCVWVQDGSLEKRACPAVLPEKYNRVHVASRGAK
tara:strand:+ start:3096 stop:3323 length:228 start_codon:yes stop_codon:yes gene_type:complete